MFIETMEVRVVNVDVVVRDKKGNPVSGLTTDDFRILENGQPVEITNFLEVTSTTGALDTAAPSEATTGTEALEVFSSHDGDVDLVVSDVVMPEMDGPTLMKHLRSQRPDVKIIFISGYAEDAFKRSLSEKDDFMFLQKPFDLKELAAAVKAALQG